MVKQIVSPEGCYQAAVGPQKVVTEQVQHHVTAMLAHLHACSCTSMCTISAPTDYQYFRICCTMHGQQGHVIFYIARLL